jgi:hypothetical protein
MSGRAISVADQAADGVKSVPRRPSVRPGTSWLAGLTPKRPLPISCECRSCREYFAVGAWYVFVRISFCCVFELSTQELHYGQESKEKESEEEEVILRLSVATLSAAHEIGGWTCPAAFRLSGRLSLARYAFDGHLGLLLSPISALIRLISASSSAPITAGQQRMAAPSGTPRVIALLAPAASMP